VVKPVIDGENIRARCPTCDGALTTFESRKMGIGGHDAVIGVNNGPNVDGRYYQQTLYRGLRCAGCGGGMAVYGASGQEAALIAFFPRSLDNLELPPDVPEDLRTEFRESELAASVGAWRAASAMLRSTLEKTLKHDGYLTGSLASKIDQAASDGVITAARSKRAHD
jgi:hypothetical protein